MTKKKEHVGYNALKDFLDKADKHYIEGRMLWLNRAYDGGGSLLWLAMEQILKIRIVEKMIQKGEVNNVSEKIYKELDYKFKKIGGDHNIDTLNGKFSEYFGCCIRCYLENYGVNCSEPKFFTGQFFINASPININVPFLANLSALFHRRYVRNEQFSIVTSSLDQVDLTYLLLRSKASSSIYSKIRNGKVVIGSTEFSPKKEFKDYKIIEPSLIDEILIRKKFSLEYGPNYYSFLFEKNDPIGKIDFLNKEYPFFLYSVGDGSYICYDGEIICRKSSKDIYNQRSLLL